LYNLPFKLLLNLSHMKKKILGLLPLLMGLAIAASAQDATADLNKGPRLIQGEGPPAYIGPGNITKDLGRLKKGEDVRFTVRLSGLSGQTDGNLPVNAARRAAYQVTGYKLPEATQINNSSLDNGGTFVGWYDAANIGPIYEVIEITSTTGTFFVYLKGEVVEGKVTSGVKKSDGK
jgi:hypothetical protein